MAEINRVLIKNLATDDITYNRGVRYYSAKAIKTISKSKSKEHYRATVQGKSEYTVDIDLTNQSKIEYKCNCPASRRHPGACKHAVAVMLFINDYSDRRKQQKIESGEKRRITRILDYFDNMDYMAGLGDIFHVKLNIKLDAMLRTDNSVKAAVSIMAGSTRFYKVQNIRKFLSDYIHSQPISLGKDFAYFPGENRFDHESEAVLDFLCEILDIQEIVGKGNSAGIFAKSDIFFDRHMLLRLLKILKLPFNFTFADENFENISFVVGKPDLNFYLNLSDEDDSIILSWDDERIIPLDEKGNLFYYDNAIYHPDRIFTRHFLPFYHTPNDGEDDALVFEGEEKERFLNVVLPRIHETFSLTIPKALKDNYITENVKFELYMDIYKGSIKLEVITAYGEYKFNPFLKMPDVKVVIVRKPSREAECFEDIEALGFIREEQYFYLSDEKDIYDFLKNSLEYLSEKYELFYSEEFKKIKVNQPKVAKTSVRVQSDNNMLEVDFDFEGLSSDELTDLFNSLKLKKKFFRLKNGSFIDLTGGGELSKLNELIDKIGSSKGDIKDGKIYTSLDYAFYLNQAADEGLYKIEADKSFIALIDEIKHPEKIKIEVPSEIKAELRPYQEVGFEWLSSLAKYYLGGILADDMGLGKTLQAITYIVSTWKKNKNATFIVVCPSSLLYNWQDEIENFCPELSTIMILGNPNDRKDLIAKCNNYQVVLVSYPILRRDIELLREISFDTAFLDEAQFIKNPNSRNAKAVKMLNAAHRFALTGTPIENNLSELWSIFDFLMPGYLYSHSKFVNMYEKPVVRFESEEALKQLNFHIKPFIMRRMKKDVLEELPEKTEKKMVSDMTDEQKEVYMSYLDDMKKKINSEINKNGFEKSRMMILASLTRLRQICCHPSTFIENYEGGSGKLSLLLQLVQNAIESGHRILVFSQFTSMLNLIEEEFKKLRISYYYLDGSTPISQRSEDVKAFNNGSREVYLISLKAGGTGLNLVGADMVIHYDPWWNPAVEDQATDRVYRIGQKNSVNVVKLITKGTIEEKIYKLQEKKKNLADSVIKAGEVFINKLTKEEVEDLFNF